MLEKGNGEVVVDQRKIGQLTVESVRAQLTAARSSGLRPAVGHTPFTSIRPEVCRSAQCIDHSRATAAQTFRHESCIVAHYRVLQFDSVEAAVANAHGLVVIVQSLSCLPSCAEHSRGEWIDQRTLLQSSHTLLPQALQ